MQVTSVSTVRSPPFIIGTGTESPLSEIEKVVAPTPRELSGMREWYNPIIYMKILVSQFKGWNVTRTMHFVLVFVFCLHWLGKHIVKLQARIQGGGGGSPLQHPMLVTQTAFALQFKRARPSKNSYM